MSARREAAGRSRWRLPDRAPRPARWCGCPSAHIARGWHCNNRRFPCRTAGRWRPAPRRSSRSAALAAQAPCSGAGSRRRRPGSRAGWDSARRGRPPAERRRPRPRGLPAGAKHKASPFRPARARSRPRAQSSAAGAIRCDDHPNFFVGDPLLVEERGVGLLAELAVEALRARECSRSAHRPGALTA